MSLVFAASRAKGALLPALAVSVAAHVALAGAFLATPEVPPETQEQSLKGRDFIDLAEVEMLMAAPETDLTEGDVAQDSAPAHAASCTDGAGVHAVPKDHPGELRAGAA